jgi:hypothetical protein
MDGIEGMQRMEAKEVTVEWNDRERKKIEAMEGVEALEVSK